MYIHPRLRRLHRAHLVISALLLAILIVLQFSDAFAVERAVIRLDFREMVNLERGKYALASLAYLGALVVLLSMPLVLSRLLGAPAVMRRTERTAVVTKLPLAHVARGIEQRLWAAGFRPEAPPPDAFEPRIVAVRRPPIWKIGYGGTRLRIEIELKEAPDQVEVRGSLRRSAFFSALSVDTGERDYDEALLDHLIAGEPMRTVGGLGIAAVGCMQGSWILAALLAALIHGWMPIDVFYRLALLSAAVPSVLFIVGCLQVIMVRNVNGTELACAASLLMVCGAILARSAVLG
jgi:hypothetical protein